MGNRESMPEDILKTLEDPHKRGYRYFMSRGATWLTAAKILKLAADKILADIQTADEYLIKRGELIEQGLPTEDLLPLASDLQMFPVYMLLAGCTIENSFKGIIICQTWMDNRSLVDLDRFVDIKLPCKNNTKNEKITTHNLLKLLEFDAMNLTFDDDQKAVMKALTEYIEWAGRFPTSLFFHRHNILPLGYGSLDYRQVEIINAIYKKSIKKLEALEELQRSNPGSS
jgi:hypothetical protein